MMSDSTNTVQTDVSRTGFLARSEIGPISSSPIPVTSAAADGKRPVPAAHLSFMAKSMTEPSAPTLIALVSWPPMSITVRVRGKIECAPRAWQGISVIWASPKGTLYRPYPGPTQGVPPGPGHVRPGGDQRPGHDGSGLIQNPRLRLGRADIDSRAENHDVLLRSVRFASVIGRRGPAGRISSDLAST